MLLLNGNIFNPAEHLAKIFNLSREEQDAFALESQTKALNAIQNNYFAKEIVGVKNAKVNLITSDEYIRSTTLEALGKLPPAFHKVSYTVCRLEQIR